MGSFNTTCFASQQTIAPGDPCYVIGLTQHGSYEPVSCYDEANKKYSVNASTDSTCYATAFWKPFELFIETTYDDYGNVTLVDNPYNNQNVMSLFTKLETCILKTEQGDNQYHDVPCDLKNWLLAENFSMVETWNLLWDACSEHRAFVLDAYNTPREFQFAIISASAYNYLVSMAEKLIDFDDVSMTRKNVLARAVTEMDTIQAQFTDGSNNNEITCILRDTIKGHPAEGMPRVNNPRFDQYVIEYQTTGKLSNKTKKDVYKDMAYRYVFRGLNMLNLKLSPVVYASQDYDNEIGQNYSKFVNTVSKKITNMRKD